MIGLLLTIDIGNTNLTIGAYSGEELKFVSRLATDRSRTEDQYAIELKSIFDLYSYGFDEFTGCAISSVVPELTGAVSHAAKRITGSEPIVLGPGVKTGINILADDPSQAGADLVAASVAARISMNCRALLLISELRQNQCYRRERLFLRLRYRPRSRDFA